ncbi:hypothetical protein G6F56_005055 [Rhizopus delemar]|nr:hypothetical protein G6F56_005055 [Rhizopus delemar]
MLGLLKRFCNSTSTVATPTIASTMPASSHYEQNGRHSLYANNRMIIDPPVTDTRNYSVLSENDESFSDSESEDNDYVVDEQMLDLDLKDFFDESISVTEPLESYVNSLDASKSPDIVTENFNTFMEALLFKSIIAFVLLAFFYCCDISISEQKIKLAMLIYVVRKRKNEEHAFSMNKLSTYLKLLMSNRVKNPNKWKHDPMLQTHMVTLANCNDIWVGNLVEIHRPDGLVPTFLLVTRFFQSREDFSNYVTYAQDYLVQKFAYVHDEGCMSRLQARSLSRKLRDTDDATVIEQMGKEDYTKNGSEQFLRLESYNPLLDTLVEFLHTLPLGVGKPLIQFLLKTTLTATQLTILQTALTEHHQCKAYARCFRSLANHSGSFLGRDFKILEQILPVVIKDAFPNIVEGDMPDITAKCLELYGSLTSLLYMRSVTGNIGSFLKLVQIQEIKRFGMPIHYETKHGEKFNKFIREEILRTNRNNPSRDLAVAFSRQFFLQHLINGGSFLTTVRNAQNDEEIRRVATVSSGVQQFNKEFPDFLKILLTNRENSENNDYIESSEDMLVVGTSGMFMHINKRSFFGYIDKVERNPVKYCIQNYVLVKQDASIPSSSFFLKRVSQTILRPEDVDLKMRLDMHRIIQVKRLTNECRLLNIHKFGNLSSLLELISR